MLLLRLYRLLTFLAAPVLRASLKRRAARGREDKARLAERFGRASQNRPEGALVWVHAASVGETNSVLPLIRDILTLHPRQHILLTTGTVTAASIAARFGAAQAELSARLIHQYVPLDRMAWNKRFLDTWRPDAAFWVESEIWPNMIEACSRRDIPLVMVNGRLSPRSFGRWQKRRATAQHLLGQFHLLTAQDAMTAERLTALGLNEVNLPGNLKLDAPPLTCDAAAFKTLSSALAGRPVWLAASTHPGEEALLANVHNMLKDAHENLLSIIVPRHPDRGDAIAAALRKSGLRVAQRSHDAKIAADTDIYLMDTLGEMGLAYHLAEIVFIGGTLVPHGGQNPFEAAQLDCAILHGPHIENFETLFADLTDKGATTEIADSATLAAQVKALLNNPSARQQMAEAAKTYSTSMSGARRRMRDLLRPYLAAETAPAKNEARHG